MTPVPASTPGPPSLDNPRDQRANPLYGPRPRPVAHGRPPSTPFGPGRRVVTGARRTTSSADTLEDVVAQIDRARSLIRTWRAGARSAFVDELDDVADDLDAAIRRFHDAVRVDHTTFTETVSPAPPFMQWAWSEVERRWISMTFHEHQAWLARPDLDPAEFAFHQAAL